MTDQAATADNGHREYDFWRDHTRVNLIPLAAPSILGFFALGTTTFMVAANLAGWYGNTTTTPLFLFPFALAFGGITQLLAAMWAFRARDALATGMHGAWGAHWIGYAILHLFIAIGVLPPPTTSAIASTAFGFWLIGLAVVTWFGAAAAFGENISAGLVLVALAGGATALAVAMITRNGLAQTVAGYFLIVASVLAWYTAGAMLLESIYKRVILPVGKHGAEPNVPGAKPQQYIQFTSGEPGVKLGQ